MFSRLDASAKARLGVRLSGIFAAAAVICAVSASPGMAAKAAGGSRGGGDTSSLKLTVVYDANGDGSPNYSDSVTFIVSTGATTEPYVSLNCYQNGTLVYGAMAGFFAGYPWPESQTFPLSSPSWTGGAASCTATLYYFNGRKNITLKTLNVSVAA